MNTLESPRRRRLPRPVGPRGAISTFAAASRIRWILASVPCFWCVGRAALAATPVVSGVAGAVSTGETLTVTGSNMVDEDKSLWDPFFSAHPDASGFEGASPSADGYGHNELTNPTGPSTSGAGYVYAPVYDSTVKLMGNQSVKYHVQGVASPPVPVVSFLYMLNSLDKGGGGSGLGDLWARWYSRYNLLGGAWPPGYLKEFLDGDYLDSVAGMATSGPGLCGGVVGTNTPTPDAFTVKIGNTTYCTDILPDNLLQNNRWYVVEVHFNNTSSPVLEVYVNNARLFL